MSTPPPPLQTQPSFHEFTIHADGNPSTSSLDSTPASATNSETTEPLTLNTQPRIDSFPKSLPLPASSVISPTSAHEHRQSIDYLSAQGSKPSDAPSTFVQREMLVQDDGLASPPVDERSSTPLAELPASNFDEEIAMKRKGGNVSGSDSGVTDKLAELDVKDESKLDGAEKEASLGVPEADQETKEKRKNDPAVLAMLPGAPSAEDFAVARDQGSEFKPEFAEETKVA